MLTNFFSLVKRLEPLWIGIFLLVMWLMFSDYSVGVAAEALIIVFIATYTIIRRWLRDKSAWDVHIAVPFLLSFIVYSSLLLLKVPLPQHSLDYSVHSIALIIVFMFLSSQITEERKRELWESVFVYVVLGFATLEFLLFFVWVAKWVAISGSILIPPPIGYRLSGTFFSGPNFTGASLNLVLPLVVVRLIQAGQRQRKIYTSSLLLIVVISYFSSSRTSWIAALVSVGVTLFVMFRPLGKERATKGKTPSLFLSRGNAIFGVLAMVLVIALVLVFMRQSLNTPGHIGILSGREIIWANAWRIWSTDLIFGRGPATFPLYYSMLSGTPGNWLPDQAHNIWLQVGAETGIIGILFWLALIAWFAFISIGTWKTLARDPKLRGHFSAYIGISVGVLVQQQTDYYFHIPLYSVFVLILLAMFSELINLQRLRVSALVIHAIYAFLLVVYVGGTVFASKGNRLQAEAQLAYSNGESLKAKNLSCSAADEAPQFTIYTFQCARLNAEFFHVSHNPSDLEEAVRRTREALARDPFWPIHWANLGILEWQSGERLVAFLSMERAAESAHDNSILTLNYGWMAEQLQKDELAIMAYQQAIQSDPWLFESHYFQSTPLRQAALDQSYAFAPEDEFNLKAYEALIRGDLFVAKKSVDFVLDIDPRNPESLALLSLIEHATGNQNQAFFLAQKAVFLDALRREEDQNPRIYVWASKVAINRGENEIASNWLGEAFYIWKTKRQYDTVLFNYYIYHRHLLLDSFVPGYQRADLTKEMVLAFNWLANYYRTEGKSWEASQMDFWLGIEVSKPDLLE